MSETDISSYVTSFANERGLDREVVLQQALKEAKHSVRMNVVEKELQSSGGGADEKLGDGRGPGDIFYAPASTFFIQHGHSGMYTAPNRIVHAPGHGYQVRTGDPKTLKVSKGYRKQWVNTDHSTRIQAVNFAVSKIGSEYNDNFAFNKKIESSTYNCSQLVWAAYKRLGIDLDSDGGFGVYPVDIRDSPNVTNYP